MVSHEDGGGRAAEGGGECGGGIHGGRRTTFDRFCIRD